MKTSFILLLLFSTLFTNNLKSEEITEQSFLGKWCGKWDQVYSFCLIIDDIGSNSSKDSLAKYQWKEFTDGKFKKSNKTVSRINRNTLKIDNIILVLNESDLLKADVVGIFKVRSRISEVTKQISDVK